MSTLNIALAQLNLTVGDIAGNSIRIRTAAKTATAQGAHLMVTPELSMCGYPAEDLLLRPAFIDAAMQAVRQLAADSAALLPMLVGTPWRYRGKVYNAAVLVGEGKMRSATFKRQLPNHGVFDERRVFAPGGWPKPLPFRGLSLGVQLCEDVWSAGVSKVLRQRGAALLVVMNASPFEQPRFVPNPIENPKEASPLAPVGGTWTAGKLAQRLDVTAQRSRETALSLLYVNMVGGQDEVVFDGRSFALFPNGQPALFLPAWEETVKIIRWTIPAGTAWV